MVETNAAEPSLAHKQTAEMLRCLAAKRTETAGAESRTRVVDERALLPAPLPHRAALHRRGRRACRLAAAARRLCGRRRRTARAGFERGERGLRSLQVAQVAGELVLVDAAVLEVGNLLLDVQPPAALLLQFGV